MLDNLDRSVFELCPHVVCVRLVWFLLVRLEGELHVIEPEVDVLLALELVGYSFDHLDEHQTVVYFLHVVVQFVRLELCLHCFGALAPNDRV